LKSLERRFVVSLALMLIVAFAVLLWFSVKAVQSISDSYITTRLEHDAEALLSAIKKNPRGQLHVREGRITPIYQQALSGHYYQIDVAGGLTIRSRSLWDESLQVRHVDAGQVISYRINGPSGKQLLLRSAGYRKQGFEFVLTVAEELESLADEIWRFQWMAVMVFVVTVIMLLMVSRYILRRGFRSLDQVRNEVELISKGQVQFLQEHGPEETRPLTIEINRLLQQLQNRLRRSRDALGNLAHALKAPVSLMTHDIDTLALETEDKNRLNKRLTRISQLIDRELKRARIAGDDVGHFFNPASAIPDLVDALKQLYTDRNIDIECSNLPDETLPVDHEDMLELLGNLLDNACKWADSKVVLSVEKNDKLKIIIADDGPGINEQKRMIMLERGKRLDEQEAGHGLGLAIVKDLIDDYRGEIAFDNSSVLGGLLVTVELPLS
jgi:signal transduction histidine kinase